MLNERQIKLLHDFFSGIGNRYGALSLDDIDIDNIDSSLKDNSREEIEMAISQMQDRRFVINNNIVFTTQKPQTELLSVFDSYVEFEKPSDITYSDVEDYIDIENLIETQSFKNLKEYCIEKSPLEDKMERAYRFNWTFYFSANGISVAHFDQLSPFVSKYFEIEDNRDLKALCFDALKNQVSWMCAGRKGSETKASSWINEAAKKAELELIDVYSIHNFCQAVANYYGYILIKDAYRIFKSITKNHEGISKEQFITVCDVASDTFPIYQIDGAIASVFLMEERSLKYWSDKTKQSFIAEDPSRTEADTLFLSILLLIQEQGDRQLNVPSLSTLQQYMNVAFVAPTLAYNKLIELLAKDNDEFNLALFNKDFNFFSNMVCENMALLRADTLEVLGINKLDEAEKMQALKYLEIAMKEVPCWALRGLAQKDVKKKNKK